jgi:hypothetical protein
MVGSFAHGFDGALNELQHIGIGEAGKIGRRDFSLCRFRH